MHNTQGRQTERPAECPGSLGQSPHQPQATPHTIPTGLRILPKLVRIIANHIRLLSKPLHLPYQRNNTSKASVLYMYGHRDNGLTGNTGAAAPCLIKRPSGWLPTGDAYADLPSAHKRLGNRNVGIQGSRVTNPTSECVSGR